MTDQDILTKYYKDNFQRLVASVTIKVGDEETAKDIVQDGFVNILMRTETIIPSTIGCLVRTVVGRLVCDYWRRKRPQHDYERLVLASNSSANSDPLTICSANDIKAWMERGMARLSNPQNIVFRMNVCDGMKVSKIAQALDANYKTVEQRLGLARKSMRRYMRKVANQ